MSPRSSNPSSIRLLRRVIFSTAGLDQVKSIRGFILPVALSLAAIGLTTLVIIEAHSNLTALRDWRDSEHLTLAYVLPPIFVAVFIGSIAAVMTSFASALAAAYFIYPPQYSFLVYEPRHIVELGFVLALSVTASKAVAVIIGDKPLARHVTLRERGDGAAIP
jgi:K+-sensing histidine kinase KdpD